MGGGSGFANFQGSNAFAGHSRCLCPIPEISAIWKTLPLGYDQSASILITAPLEKLYGIKQELFSLWKSVLSEKDSISIYRALRDSLLCLAVLGDVLNTADLPEDFKGDPDLIESLHDHCVGQYIGPSCSLLRDKIRGYEKSYSKVEDYAKSILVYNLVALASHDWQVPMVNSVRWSLSSYETTRMAFRLGMVRSLMRCVVHQAPRPWKSWDCPQVGNRNSAIKVWRRDRITCSFMRLRYLYGKQHLEMCKYISTIISPLL